MTLTDDLKKIVAKIKGEESSFDVRVLGMVLGTASTWEFWEFENGEEAHHCYYNFKPRSELAVMLKNWNDIVVDTEGGYIYKAVITDEGNKEYSFDVEWDFPLNLLEVLIQVSK